MPTPQDKTVPDMIARPGSRSIHAHVHTADVFASPAPEVQNNANVSGFIDWLDSGATIIKRHGAKTQALDSICHALVMRSCERLSLRA